MVPLHSSRAKGDEFKRKKYAFLALAFQEFDLNEDNLLSKGELRKALAAVLSGKEIKQVVHLCSYI